VYVRELTDEVGFSFCHSRLLSGTLELSLTGETGRTVSYDQSMIRSCAGPGSGIGDISTKAIAIDHSKMSTCEAHHQGKPVKNVSNPWLQRLSCIRYE